MKPLAVCTAGIMFLLFGVCSANGQSLAGLGIVIPCTDDGSHREGTPLADTPGIQEPTVARTVQPRYTGQAIGLEIQGTVSMEILIGEDGSVEAVCVIRGLDRDLDREAVTAAQQWQFNPAMRGNQAVAVWAELELSFTLRPE